MTSGAHGSMGDGTVQRKKKLGRPISGVCAGGGGEEMEFGPARGEKEAMGQN
jgi:hypothetical protein